jgi:hypothetical protein
MSTSAIEEWRAESRKPGGCVMCRATADAIAEAMTARDAAQSDEHRAGYQKMADTLAADYWECKRSHTNK